MSDSQNSAEKEAEQILESAYADARAEECPQGTDCPVHFRMDEEYFDGPLEYARLITYVGEYAVITEDNQEYGSPGMALGILLGVIKKEDLPPRFETTIVHVGSGVIGDLIDLPLDEARKAYRLIERHDDWELVKSMHDTTVVMLKQGLVDVSKPLGE